MNPLEQLGFPMVEIPETCSTTSDVIRFLVDCLVDCGELHAMDADLAMDCVLNRESQGSTNLLGGAALPHSKFNPIDHVIGIIGRPEIAITWASDDRAPVRMVVLMLMPTHAPGLCMRGLEAAVRALRHEYPPPVNRAA